MNKEVKITNIEDLRKDLSETYEALRAGTIGIRECKEVANMGGKIISTAKLQLEYNVYTKSKERIPFLEINQPEAV